MYSDVNKLIESITLPTFLHLMNDEQREAEVEVPEEDVEYYDLTDPTDIMVIRANDLINKSDAEINSYLRGRFTLPLGNVPVEIEELSIRKTIKRMYERRHKADMPESIISQDRDDNKYLLAIQRGDVTPDIQGEESNAGSIIKTNQRDKLKTFTDDYLKDY